MTTQVVDEIVAAESADRGGDGATAHGAPSRSSIDLATVFGLAVALVGVGIGASRLADNSFLTHLATGRYVVDNGFLREDVFTWTSNGDPVVVQSWLASALYGLVDAAAGFHGLRLLMAAIAGAVGWLCWRLTERSPSLVTRVVVIAPVLLIGLRTWTERPLLMGLALLGVTLVVAEGSGRSWWLGVAGAVWVSVHGSWPLGLVLLGGRWVGARLDREPTRRELECLGYLATGVLVAGILNPYGPALLTFPIELFARQETLSHITEWRAPDFQSQWTRAFLVLVLGAIVAVGRRLSWRTAVPALLFLAAALTSRRNIPVATLVFLPVLAGGLPAVRVIDGHRTSHAIRLAGRGLIVLLVALPLVAVRSPHVDTGRYPVAAVDAMEQLGLSPADVHVVHPDFAGNYIDLRFGDAEASWIDDRFELHDDALVEDYLLLLDGGPGWDEVLTRHGADALLWPTNEVLVELAREVGEWHTVWSDEDWSVLCRPASC